MAADKNGFVTVTRLIEISGPPKWVEEILRRSFVPLNGTKMIGGKGAYMRGGMVMWSPEPAVEAVENAGRGDSEHQGEVEQSEQPSRPRFEDTLRSEPNRNAPPPLRVPKPTGVK